MINRYISFSESIRFNSSQWNKLILHFSFLIYKRKTQYTSDETPQILVLFLHSHAVASQQPGFITDWLIWTFLLTLHLGIQLNQNDKSQCLLTLTGTQPVSRNIQGKCCQWMKALLTSWEWDRPSWPWGIVLHTTDTRLLSVRLNSLSDFTYKSTILKSFFY